MQHRGVRYAIRMGIEPDAWSVAIYPGDTEAPAKRVYGTREDAEREARSMIDRWTQGKPITRGRQSRRQKPGAVSQFLGSNFRSKSRRSSLVEPLVSRASFLESLSLVLEGPPIPRFHRRAEVWSFPANPG